MSLLSALARNVRPLRLILPLRWRWVIKDWARRWPNRRPFFAKCVHLLTGARADPPDDLEENLPPPDRSANRPNPHHPSPLITVVIPCYNSGRFLPQALASVWDQSLTDLEVVVVDDGSTERETTELIDSLRDPRIRIVRQANRGLAGARNSGFREARGKYVCPLDADDLLAPTHLEKLTLAAESRQCEIAFCDVSRFGAWEGVWRTGPFVLDHLLRGNVLTCNALIRRDAWESAGGYREALRHGYEDWELWIRLAAAGCRAVKVPEPLFHYRRHGPSLLSITNRRQEEIREEIRSLHADLFTDPARSVPPRPARRLLASDPFRNLGPERHAPPREGQRCALVVAERLAPTPHLRHVLECLESLPSESPWQILVASLDSRASGELAPRFEAVTTTHFARPMLPPELIDSFAVHLAHAHRVTVIDSRDLPADRAACLQCAVAESHLKSWVITADEGASRRAEPSALIEDLDRAAPAPRTPLTESPTPGEVERP